LILAARAAAGDFTHYESSHVHPIALSTGRDHLYAVNTPEARVAIFDVPVNGTPRFVGDVPVGLEPVSLAVRPGSDEVWVVNHLSDSVSVVDASARKLVATLSVGDEPTDVVFAGGRAFVSVSGKDDRVDVFDASSRTLIRSISIPGEDPHALTATADGSLVALVVLESGNQTTVVPPALVGAPPPPDPPLDPTLPPPPRPVGLIVQFDPATGQFRDERGGNRTAAVQISLRDWDLFVIDPTRPEPALVAAFSAVGTTLFDVAIHPVRPEFWVPNTEARNLVRFEPNLRGHLVETRISIMSFFASPRYVDLNPHIDYTVTPGPPAEIEQSLSQPGNGVFSSSGDRFYLTAFGSGKIAVLDGETAAVLQRIRVGGGPSGLVLNEPAKRLYVLNRFDNTVSTIDLEAGHEIAVTGVAGPSQFDPSPEEIRRGRRFLYDAALSSGHGDVACATCHVFGAMDGLAWDLGDPQGKVLTFEEASWVRFLERRVDRPGFHPMKGPMTTQTLRGLRGMEPFHWRGDRRNFQHFNGAFVSLLGRAEPLPDTDMEAFTDFIMTVELPPNPYRNIDGSLPAAIPVVRGLRTPSVGDPARGESLFASRCANCHALPKGTSNELIATTQRPQEFKVPHLRNVYEKVDLDVLRTFDIPVSTRSNQRRRGSFVLNDGVAELPILIEAMSQGGGETDADDLMAYVLAFSTDSFACVGRQLSLGKGDPAGDAGPLIAEAQLGHCDLVAKGVSGGVPAGWVYDRVRSGFLPDSAREPIIDGAALRDGIGPGELVTFTAVPPGNGVRLGVDRDRDGCLDRDELRKRTDPANPGVRKADADDDGLSDDTDLCPGWTQLDGLQTDTNANGIPNECECGDVSNDGRLDLRDLLYMALHLARRDPPGMALAKCNVSGAPGDAPANCTWDDFFALRRGLEQSIVRRSVPRFPPLCRPAAPALPASDVCVNPAP
jgi:YVTN family beta-propeller protein